MSALASRATLNCRCGVRAASEHRARARFRRSQEPRAEPREAPERSLKVLFAVCGEVGAHQLVCQRVGVHATPLRLGGQQRVGAFWQVDRSRGHARIVRPPSQRPTVRWFDYLQGYAAEPAANRDLWSQPTSSRTTGRASITWSLAHSPAGETAFC
jgi:hypothetical protein